MPNLHMTSGEGHDIWCKSVITLAIDINRDKYDCPICSIGHMTFMLKIDLAIMQINMHVKNEDVASKYYEVIMLTDIHRDTPETISF